MLYISYSELTLKTESLCPLINISFPPPPVPATTIHRLSGIKRNYSLGRLQEGNCKAFVKIFGRQNVPVCLTEKCMNAAVLSVLCFMILPQNNSLC